MATNSTPPNWTRTFNFCFHFPSSQSPSKCALRISHQHIVIGHRQRDGERGVAMISVTSNIPPGGINPNTQARIVCSTLPNIQTPQLSHARTLLCFWCVVGWMDNGGMCTTVTAHTSLFVFTPPQGLHLHNSMYADGSALGNVAKWAAAA